MRVRVIVVLVFLCGATTLGTWPIQDDTLKFSCAVFPVDLSEADLIDRYGAESVISAPVFGVDDGPVDGTALFPDVNDRIEITWWYTEAKRRPAWIRVRAERQVLRGEFSSGRPSMQALNPTVVAIWIRYPNR